MSPTDALICVKVLLGSAFGAFLLAVYLRVIRR